MAFVLYLIVAILVIFIDGWAPTRSVEEGIFRLGIGHVYLMEWLIYGLLAAYVLMRMFGGSSRNRSKLFQRTALDKPLLRFGLLLPAFAVYGLLRGNPLQEAAGYYEWRSLFAAIVFYFLLTSILDTPEKAGRLFHWFLGLCALKASYYLFFYLFGIPYPFEKIIGAGTVAEGAENVMFVFAGLPAISLWLFREKKHTGLEKLAPWAALAIMVNLMISAKRTIQLGFLLGLVILLVRLPWRRLLRSGGIATAAVAITALVLSVVGPAGPVSGVSASVSRYGEISNFIDNGDLLAASSGDGTLAFHLLDYLDAGDEIKQHPILGSGFGSQYARWYTTFPGVGGEGAGLDTGMVHCLYLHFWWKMGVVGLIAFVALLVRYFSYVSKSLPRLPLSATQAVTLGLYAALWAELSMDFWGAQWIGSTKDPFVILMAIALTICLLRRNFNAERANPRDLELAQT